LEVVPERAEPVKAAVGHAANDYRRTLPWWRPAQHLRAAARAELERLRRMPDNQEAKSSEPSSVRVAPLLSDLAALHGAAGAAIELNVANDLQALMPPECLAHIVTNLLVNCARHAPGA
jgi:two-component system, OmpR family, sensor kinase